VPVDVCAARALRHEFLGEEYFEQVALGTDTLYGLAVDPFNRAAVSRLFDVNP
jgi:tRNA A37 threonylcarbamoyladenosine synthetase subunit TsaC/SUA5/YrdC